MSCIHDLRSLHHLHDIDETLVGRFNKTQIFDPLDLDLFQLFVSLIMNPDEIDDGSNVVLGRELGQLKTDQIAKPFHQGNQHWSTRKGLANHTNVFGAVLDKIQGNVIQQD